MARKIDFVSSEENVQQPILVQINQGGELSKSGADPDSIKDLIAEILSLNNVIVQGFMSIPPFHEPARPYFSELSRLRDDIQKDLGIELPFLSMGMSGDYVEAISEGATHIRVGTSIFGER